MCVVNINAEIDLRTTLDRFHKLSNNEFAQFLEVCTYREFSKKDILLKAGNYNYGIYFIISGVVGLSELIDGKEIYQNFFLKSEFAFELQSLSSQSYSKKELIALADTQAYYLNRNKLLNLYDQGLTFERLGRKLLEHMLKEQNEITNALQSFKPEERYTFLKRHRPELLHAVPLTYLASYLGIARETLSRIRSKR